MEQDVLWEDWRVTVTLERKGGRYRPVGFAIESAKGSRPLDSTVIRRIPFGMITMAAIREAGKPQPGTVERDEAGNLTIRAPVAKAEASAPIPRVETKGPLPASHYREVARVYRKAYRKGLPNPTRAVQEHFRDPDRPGFPAYSTVARWVSIARNERHLLPPTDKYTPRA